jgi:hypothetical protein
MGGVNALTSGDITIIVVQCVHIIGSFFAYLRQTKCKSDCSSCCTGTMEPSLKIEPSPSEDK